MKYLLFLAIAIVLFQPLSGQEYKGIKYAGKNYESKCRKCLDVIASMPPEVQFSLFRDVNGEDPWDLYFSISDPRWFPEFFKGSADGLAVDIISKNQIVCNGENSFGNSWLSMGKMTDPIFFKEMKVNTFVTEDGRLFIKVGKIPSALRGQELEYNLILVKNKYFCYYQRFYDLPRYRWDLLDMGLYMDSLEYGINYDTSQLVKSTSSFLTTRMNFVIPFEKNKWTYKQEDIKPFYDSLKLENFNIKRIEIRAYSSVEGSTEKNSELQQKRAESIISVLQENQLMEIEKVITTSENWVEFYEDILGSGHKNLAHLSKSEIKVKLENKSISEDLEQILSHHRKAVIILDVERKTNISESKEELVTAFQKAIAEENVERAREIQRAIYTYIADNQIPEEVVDEMEIPRQIGFGPLLNNQSAFRHFLHPSEILETYKDFKEIDVIMPNNKRVRYNLIAMKFRVWMTGLDQIDPISFEKEIKDLKKLKISSKLIKRMLINYNILMSEAYFYQGDYEKKDIALSYIKKNYRYVEMRDNDLLSLAQYFASYARFDWATGLLVPHIRSVDANEDLLFYYINLTISDETMFKKDSYKNIILNAIALNRTRFCRFFDSMEKGGASFQLLMNDKLKDMYCQDCRSKMM